MKIIVSTILIFVVFIKMLSAQQWVSQENTIETNWNITLQVGRTALLSEINTNFKGISNDMNNMSDWGFNIQIAKMVWERVDIGAEFTMANYKGFKSNPSNVAYLMQHYYYNTDGKDFEPYPIYYDSDFTNFSAFVKYNFINFSSWTKGYFMLNLYVKMGVGVAFPTSEMGYSEKISYKHTGLTHPLYSKGRYPNTNKDAHNFFTPAFGLNYQLSERLFFSAEASFQLIGADNLDGVHNYANTLRTDTPRDEVYLHRIRVYTLTAKFMFGVTYFFNFDSEKNERERQLPWYKQRYRSYYSDFHRPSTKIRRQTRQPFYRHKFKDE